MGFILRVDDVGWNPPDKSPDRGLAYFTKWREALGLQGCPVYYGVIPQTVGPDELDKFKRLLYDDEELAVHGWDHARGAVVEAKHMDHALKKLASTDIRCRCYIPPFNEYEPLTIEDWGRVCPHGFFFGGYQDPPSWFLPPRTYRSGYFLPAVHDLYDHSPGLLENIPKWVDYDVPLVVTMHATWGADRLDLVSQVGEMLKPHLISVDDVKHWCECTEDLTRSKLTAPHYLAYSWIMGRIKQGSYAHSDDGYKPSRNVLDFGARYSHLPTFLSLQGFKVLAVDRDPSLSQYKDALRRGWAYPVNVNTQVISEPEEIAGTFDTIVCCWSVQHNLPAEEEIPRIMGVLASRVRPGGRILLVGSFTAGNTYEQNGRADPQAVLNQEDYRRLIVGPSGMRLVKQEYFHYEHGTTTGDFCQPERACATCLELVKP